MEVTNLSKDALHVYVGLAVMLAVVIGFKRSMSDWRPLIASPSPPSPGKCGT
jgi:hypothetical protein